MHEVLHIPRDEVQSVFKGCGGDLAVCWMQGNSAQPAFCSQDFPPLSNGMRDGQKTIFEVANQIVSKPEFGFVAFSALRQKCDSFSQLTDGDHT